MKKVSVLMSTYKEPVDWVKKSVESILKQTYSNIEFIVIIDDPNNFEVIKYIRHCEKKDNRIKVIDNERNIGLVKSLNKGLQYCTGEYIARMDADDIAEINRIEEQINYIEKYGYDLIGAYMNIFNGKEKRAANKVCKTNWGCKKILNYEGTCFHPTWLVKRELYESLNGYRNIDSCEDYDFLIRAVCSNARIGNIPKVLLNYRDNGDSISHKNFNKQRLIADSLASIYRKHQKCIDNEQYKKIYENIIENYNETSIYLIEKRIYCKFIKIADCILFKYIEKRN